MDRYENRKIVILAIILIVGLVFIGRLFYIQVIDRSYKLSADNQALAHVTIYPSRGIIFDRNGKILVYNQAAYDMMVVPKDIDPGMDTNAFCSLLQITREEFEEKIGKARKYSGYRASIFEKQISADDWVVISEQLYRFPGFYGQKRHLRKYPEAVAPHILGYVGEVNENDIKKDPYYKMGDYIGISGLEKYYEKSLRGVRGVKVFTRDVHNRITGSFANGAFDSVPVPGENLHATIDIELQAYGERLMQNKKGSIVAIEPATGEILAMVSSPGYDPNILVGRARNKNYAALAANDSLNPLFNRAINAVYRPGSIFKLVESLIGLQLGVITPQTRIRCNRGIINCHGAHSYDDLQHAIQHSCNPYFYEVYRRIIQSGHDKSIFKDARFGLHRWRSYVVSFGLGQKLNTDLPGINSGFIPDVKFYDKWYGETRWAFSTIYSNSIGEGELGIVPLQMANLAAILANRGYYITPHLVRKVGDNGSTPPAYTKKNYTKIDSSYFYVVLDALEAVVNEPGGTARRARIKDIVVCGKTGTVQNVNSPDHSVFMAFAPKNDPKIAIAVYIEDAGFGGTWAAPTASLMIEKYIKGFVSDTAKEERILQADFIHTEDQQEPNGAH